MGSNDDANSTNKNFSICVELNANQVYYIKVYHHNYIDTDAPGTGAYILKVSAAAYFDTAIELQSEDEIAGDINFEGDADYYKFTTSTTGAYIFESTGSTNVAAELYDSSRNCIASDSKSGIGYNFYIPYTLDANKTYYIKVRHTDYNGTGSYGGKSISGK